MLARTTRCSTLFDRAEPVDRDGLEPARKAREGPAVGVERRTAQVVEQVVVDVVAIQRRARRVRFVEIGEIVVDEMLEWLGHVGPSLGPGRRGTSISQWYNKKPSRWPARCSSSPRQSATSRTSRFAPLGSCVRCPSSPPRTRGAAATCFATSGSAAALLSLHEHNEEARAAAVLRRLAKGESVALVSDAGTPAISDPGARLVAAVSAAGYQGRAGARSQRGDGGPVGCRSRRRRGLRLPGSRQLGEKPEKDGSRTGCRAGGRRPGGRLRGPA